MTTTDLASNVALTEARNLARLLLSIMNQFPTDPGDFDPSLAWDRLPAWAQTDRDTDTAGDDWETRVEWCAYWGGPDPDDCAGYEVFDEQGEAEAMASHLIAGGVAWRQVAEGQWALAGREVSA